MENIIIIGIVAVMIFLGIRSSVKHFRGEGGCCGGSAPVKRQKKRLEKVIAQKLVTVEGMTCAHCKNRVEKGINEIDGAAAKVSLKKGKAVVSLAKDVTDEQIREVIEKAGYRVIEIKERV